MTHFTPERYLRLGDLSNRDSFLAAHEDWEAALAAYRVQLSRIRNRLPSGLRDLIESVYLHDAAVIDMWQQDDRVFSITLLPESEPSRLVVLNYALVEPPMINREALPEHVHSEPVTWLYDELDAGATDAMITHDILLSNGWEVRLRFDSVKVDRPLGLIPACVPQPLATSTTLGPPA